MKNSWWSEVVDGGWAHEVGRNTEKIVNFLNAEIPKREYPEGLFGNGQSAKNIVDEIEALLNQKINRDLDLSNWHHKKDSPASIDDHLKNEKRRFL